MHTFTKIVGIDDDSSELRKIHDELEYTKSALEQAVAEWRTTFDTINDSVCLLDADGKILRCNRATTRSLQKPYGDIVGQTCWELIHGTSAPIAECPFCQTYKTHCRETIELQWHDRWFTVTTDPVLDNQGELVGTVHIMTDITRRKQAEEALKTSYEELEQRVRERTVELSQANRQLHREIEERKKTEAELRMFNEAMLDREERIIELKEEVNRLSAELGRKIPYEPVWEEEDIE